MERRTYVCPDSIEVKRAISGEDYIILVHVARYSSSQTLYALRDVCSGKERNSVVSYRSMSISSIYFRSIVPLAAMRFACLVS